MRGISWLAAKTGQLLKKDSAPWSMEFKNVTWEFFLEGEDSHGDHGQGS
jgi:hypothetical protein